METKKLLIPAKDLRRRSPIVLRQNIRIYFEREHRGPERIRIHWFGSKCILQLEDPIPELSPLGRLQYHIEETVTEYDMVPWNRRSIAEA